MRKLLFVRLLIRLILLLILTFFLMSKTASAQEEDVTFVLNEVSSAVGGDEGVLEVTLSTAASSAYSAGSFHLSYDDENLEIVDCSIAPQFMGVCNINASGTVLFNALNAAGFNGSATLVEVEFKKIGPDPLAVSLNMNDDVIDPSGNILNAQVDNQVSDNGGGDVVSTEDEDEEKDPEESAEPTSTPVELPPTAEPSPTATATSIQLQPTAEPTAEPTVEPTATRMRATQAPTQTPRPTATVPAPTATAAPTEIPPTATALPVEPSATLMPTETSMPLNAMPAVEQDQPPEENVMLLDEADESEPILADEVAEVAVAIESASESETELVTTLGNTQSIASNFEMSSAEIVTSPETAAAAEAPGVAMRTYLWIGFLTAILMLAVGIWGGLKFSTR